MDIFSRKFDRRVRLFLGVLTATLVLGSGFAAYALWPPNVETGYEPDQPVAFSHRTHAGTLKIDCRYCHVAVERGPHASIPTVSHCMKCHERVRPETEAGEIKPEFEAFLEYADHGRDIVWNKVNDVSDFAYFEHSRHVNAGVECAECHGAVEESIRIRREHSLKMSWCLECHRQAPLPGQDPDRLTRGPENCATCHR